MKRILFGNRDEWRQRAEAQLSPSDYDFAFTDFQTPDVRMGEYDAVIPLRLPEYRALWRVEDVHDNFLIPGRDVVKLANDKAALNAFLIDRGFGDFVPPIYGADVVYPFIYKKRIDAAGANSCIIHSPAEMHAFEGDRNLADYFKQECTPGKVEYTTHVIAVRGCMTYQRTIAFGFDSERYVRGKFVPANFEQPMPPQFSEIFGAILKRLGYNGAGCFNYKIENGAPRIFEFNPRCGGTLHLDLKGFVDAYLDALDQHRLQKAVAPIAVAPAETRTSV